MTKPIIITTNTSHNEAVQLSLYRASAAVDLIIHIPLSSLHASFMQIILNVFTIKNYLHAGVN